MPDELYLLFSQSQEVTALILRFVRGGSIIPPIPHMEKRLAISFRNDTGVPGKTWRNVWRRTLSPKH